MTSAIGWVLCLYQKLMSIFAYLGPVLLGAEEENHPMLVSMLIVLTSTPPTFGITSSGNIVLAFVAFFTIAGFVDVAHTFHGSHPWMPAHHPCWFVPEFEFRVVTTRFAELPIQDVESLKVYFVVALFWYISHPNSYYLGFLNLADPGNHTVLSSLPFFIFTSSFNCCSHIKDCIKRRRRNYTQFFLSYHSTYCKQSKIVQFVSNLRRYDIRFDSMQIEPILSTEKN